MCYEATAPPLRTEYVCPACGERTLYEDNAVWLVDFELNDCRREFAELKKTTGPAAVLDESQFCRKCSPEIDQPAIVLHLEYGDNSRHSVAGVRADDMRLLREFLTGDLMHIEQNDAETPMLQRINRLEELLGIESE